MTESENDTLFTTKVLPIMDSVKKDLQQKQLEEVGRHCNSLSFLLAGAGGPDGGAAAQLASMDSLRYTGEWNSKHTEDYIEMVKERLQNEKIEVTPEMEKQMIDKMIKDEVPKSSIDYVMKKAASNTLFYLPKALNKSPLENHIEEQAEKQYNPSTLEKGTAWTLGATADLMSMGGFGGGWGSAARYVGVDLAMNAAMDQMGSSEEEEYVPLVVAPEHREEYKAERAKEKAEAEKAQEEKPTTEPAPAAEEEPQPNNEEATEQAQAGNTSGWGNLLSTFGLNGIGDIGHNLGYVLAMLPDILVGLFTGKTKSLGLKDNIMPIASIVAGMFVKNPILKMVLIGMGGLNLLNKAGHEAMENQEGKRLHNYKTYADEALNPRISEPQIKGNCLIATIDRVPCTIALTDKVVDAYQQGALPLNTLANAVLAKSDQMQQMASENYSANEQQTQTRTLAQR